MTLDDKNMATLIQYRVEQANRTIRTVELLIQNNELNTAVNRIYYGMFYMLLAVAVNAGFETSKHQQLIGWFNKTFIKEGILPKRLGKTISQVFKSRQMSDYEAFVEFDKNEVQQLFEDMKDFIATLEDYLTKN
jgi:hypothetical protein